MSILILEDLNAIKQYVACVQLVGCVSRTCQQDGWACQQDDVHVSSLCPPAMSTACVSTFTIWSRNSLVVSVGSVFTAQERHRMRL